jgi:glycosyltransferase involved in cell wall biosynthesis
VSGAGPDAPAISFVVPVFNEQGNVENLHAELSDVAREIGRPYEILFVNDGSTDATLERLSVIAVRDPQLRVVDLDGNFGEAAALCAGFASARGAIVMSLDGDGQNDPHDLPRFLRRLERDDLDAVSGRRAERKEAFFTRVLPSRIANGLIATLTRVPVHDCGCGLKVYRRELVAGAQLPKGMNRFKPAILGARGDRVAEEATQDRPRGSGTSHYGFSRVFVVFRDLLALPLLVRRPPVGRPTVRVLAGLERGTAVAAIGAVSAAILAGGSRWPWLAAAALATVATLAANVIRFNVERCLEAREHGVFKVRRVIDGISIAERGDRRRGVLGEESTPDLQRPLGHARLGAV